jgi:hypothetical protein
MIYCCKKPDSLGVLNQCRGAKTTSRIFHESIFLLSTKSKFRRNDSFIQNFDLYVAFRFWSVTFGEIDIPTTIHHSFVEILMSKSEFRFRFRFWHRHLNSELPFRNRNFGGCIGISNTTSEFRFSHRNSDFGTIFRYQCRTVEAFFAKSQISITIAYRKGSIPTVEIEIDTPITFENFD